MKLSICVLYIRHFVAYNFQGKVFNYVGKDFTVESVTQWLTKVTKGKTDAASKSNTSDHVKIKFKIQTYCQKSKYLIGLM